MAADLYGNFINIDDLLDGTTEINDDDGRVWEGDKVFDVLIRAVNDNLQIQFDNGRISSSEYGSIYTQLMIATLQTSVDFLVRTRVADKEMDKIDAEVQRIEADMSALLATTKATLDKQLGYDSTIEYDKNEITLGESNGNGKIDEEIDLLQSQDLKVQAEKTLVDTEETVKREQWGIQDDIMLKQLDMITIDAAEKQNQVDADLLIKAKQALQIAADTDFTERKADTMEDTRRDNVRMQAAREYAEYLKYISAAGAVPSSRHFDNLVGLIAAITDGVNDDADAVPPVISQYTMINRAEIQAAVDILATWVLSDKVNHESIEQWIAEESPAQAEIDAVYAALPYIYNKKEKRPLMVTDDMYDSELLITTQDTTCPAEGSTC